MCFFLSLFYDAKLVRVSRNVREIRKPGSKIYHPRVGGLRVGIRRQQQGSVDARVSPTKAREKASGRKPGVALVQVASWVRALCTTWGW